MSDDSNEELDYWTRNGIEKPQEIIVCAANRLEGVILCGARHWDTRMRDQADRMGIKGGDEEQGFINQFGEFRTREEAYQIVGVSGQKLLGDLEYVEGIAGYLFSEHLY